MTQEEVSQIIKETVSHAKNSLLSEESNLVGEMKSSHSEIKTRLESIDERIKTANGYTAKHEQRLNSQDVLNAQITISQQAITTALADIKSTDLATLKKSDGENTKYITETKAVINVFKWLVGLIGIGNIVILIKLFKP